MINSLGPLGLIGLLALVAILFIGGFVLGLSFRSKENTGHFCRKEWLTIGCSIVCIGGAAFFTSIGDVGGAVVFGLFAALTTGILWGSSNCDWHHTRMF